MDVSMCVETKGNFSSPKGINNMGDSVGDNMGDNMRDNTRNSEGDNAGDNTRNSEGDNMRKSTPVLSQISSRESRYLAREMKKTMVKMLESTPMDLSDD
jgi:hypothetical protein